MHNRGSISIIVLVLLTVLLAGGLEIAGRQQATLLDTTGNADIQQAKYLAQGALEEAHNYLTHIDSTFTGTRPEQHVVFNGQALGSYDYTVAKSGNVYSITANGYVPNKSAVNRMVQTLTTSFTGSYVGTGIVILNNSASGALTVAGTGNMTIYGGKVFVNSASSTAVMGIGPVSLLASMYNIVGNYSMVSGATISGNKNIGTSPVSDPLSGLSEPNMSDPAVCPVQYASKQTITTVRTLSPGLYTGGILVTSSGLNNGNVTLLPGLYCINGGGLMVTQNATLTGNGVTIFNAGSAAADAVTFNMNVQVTLTPQTSTAYKGITIFQQRANTNNVTVGGNASKTRISGTVYAYGGTLAITGNSNYPNVGSLQVVNKLSVSGNANFTVNDY